jgi:cytochrome c oxidase cbb3-type subunit III
MRVHFPLLAIIALGACDREERSFRDTPPEIRNQAVTMSSLEPGGVRPSVTLSNAYEQNGWAVSEGKRLYQQMNCSGCHALGGGSIGPPLMDEEWIYGVEPENIFATIVEGRPNGMPAFRGKLTPQQVWQLVGYVRSLSGLVNKDVRTGRDDHMQLKRQEQSKETETPRRSAAEPPPESP